MDRVATIIEKCSSQEQGAAGNVARHPDKDVGDSSRVTRPRTFGGALLRNRTVAACHDRERRRSQERTVDRRSSPNDSGASFVGHLLGLRAAALALRVLGLRAAALALRVLGLRAAALALRVLGLRAAALALYAETHDWRGFQPLTT